MLGTTIAAAAAALLLSTPAPREFYVHNPHNVTVEEVHMVQSAHFDAGCK